MKKALALLLALVMVFSLAACSNSGDNNTQNPGSNTQNPGTQAPGGDNTNPPENPGGSNFDPTGKKIGFVTFGPGEFFTMLADT